MYIDHSTARLIAAEKRSRVLAFRNRVRQPQGDATPTGRAILGLCGQIYRRYTNGMVRKTDYSTPKMDGFVRMNPVVSRSKYMPKAA